MPKRAKRSKAKKTRAVFEPARVLRRGTQPVPMPQARRLIDEMLTIAAEHLDPDHRQRLARDLFAAAGDLGSDVAAWMLESAARKLVLRGHEVPPLIRAFDELGMPQVLLARHLAVSTATVNDWRFARRRIPAARRGQLVELLGSMRAVYTGWLVGRREGIDRGRLQRDIAIIDAALASEEQAQ